MDDLSIPTVIANTACHRHQANRFDPCWWIWPLRGGRKARVPAICNNRAKKAGFVGEIDPRSLRKQ